MKDLVNLVNKLTTNGGWWRTRAWSIKSRKLAFLVFLSTHTHQQTNKQTKPRLTELRSCRKKMRQLLRLHRFTRIYSSTPVGCQISITPAYIRAANVYHRSAWLPRHFQVGPKDRPTWNVWAKRFPSPDLDPRRPRFKE